MRAKLEVAIEWQLDGVSCGDDRRFWQPHAMFDAAEMQHRVPTVRSLPQLATGELAQVEFDRCVCGGERGRRPNRNDRRQDLGRPEDRLLQKGSIRICCENTTPNVGGNRRLRARFARVRRFDDRAGNPRCDAGIPTPIQSSPRPAHGHTRPATSNRTQTFASPLCTARNCGGIILRSSGCS